MAAQFSKTIHFEPSIDSAALLSNCEKAVNALGFEVKQKDEAKGKLVAKSPLSFFSWGEVISIEISKFSVLTELEIISRCKLTTQIVDWGKNRRNVMSIADLVQKN